MRELRAVITAPTMRPDGCLLITPGYDEATGLLLRAGKWPHIPDKPTRICAGMIDRDAIKQRWDAIGCKLDERGRRLFAAAEVQAAGHGGLAIVSEITGIARSTINRGEDDLDEGPLPDGQVRRKGGGPKPLSARDPTVVADLRQLVEPATLGDPMRPLIWVSKSLGKLADELERMGHAISANTVAKLLAVELGFSRQSNRKADEGSKHPDRDAQFQHINAKVVAAQAAGQPVISVDTKKKGTPPVKAALRSWG